MTQIIDRSELLIALGLGSTATDADVALAELVIPSAEASIRSFVGYTITQATYTHYLPSRNLDYGIVRTYEVINNRLTVNGTSDADILFLPERPVRSITSINEDSSAHFGQGGSDFSGANLTGGTDYELQYTTSGVCWNGIVRRINGTWPYRAGTVKVVYVAGFTAAEIDAGAVIGPGQTSIRAFRDAALLAAVIKFKQHKNYYDGVNGPVTSERLGRWGASYSQNSVATMSMTTQLPDEVKDILQPFVRMSL